MKHAQIYEGAKRKFTWIASILLLYQNRKVVCQYSPKELKENVEKIDRLFRLYNEDGCYQKFKTEIET